MPSTCVVGAGGSSWVSGTGGRFVVDSNPGSVAWVTRAVGHSGSSGVRETGRCLGVDGSAGNASSVTAAEGSFPVKGGRGAMVRCDDESC